MELKSLRQWVVWRLVPRKDKGGAVKWTKVPYDANLFWARREAKSADGKNDQAGAAEKTWTTFDTAVERYSRLRPEILPPEQRKFALDGIGFVFSGDFVGVDLDKCIIDGAMQPWASEIVTKLDSYAEISPSGTGVKLWCRGTLPTSKTGQRKGNVEIYSRGRYFAVTGKQYAGTPSEIRDCNAALSEIWKRLFTDRRASGKKRSGKTSQVQAAYVPTDEDILARAGKAKNGPKFRALMAGGTAAYGNDSSAADMALACVFAFYTGDAAQIERLMRQSRLARDKWNDPRNGTTWLQEQIAAALQEVAVRYEWKRWATDSEVEIIIGPDESRVVDEAIEALAPVDNIYQRGGALVQVVEGTKPPRGIERPKDSPKIALLRHARLRELLAIAATWYKPGEEEEQVRIHPPDWVVKAVDARGQWKGIRRLEAVVESPVLRADGTILQLPGYDQQTGLIFRPQTQFPLAKEMPTQADAVAAVEMLLEVVEDFPFQTEAHRAAWLAATLTPLARYAFYGCAPLFLIDANVPGCGKGLLTDATSQVVAGREMARMSLPRDDEEFRKRITAVAVAGEPLILIDNIASTLGCASLDAALTATSWSDRLLGESTMVSGAPLFATWYATGNNIILAADTARRTLHIRLESPEEKPEERSGFRHPDLLRWVREERPRLTVAAVTILAAYCAAGKPDMGLKLWGSFEAWSVLVRNAVVWAGQPDPANTRAELTSQADREGVALRHLLAGWEEVDPSGAGMTVAELLAALNDRAAECATVRAALLELCPPKDGKTINTRSVGMKFHHLRHRIADGRFLNRRDHRTGLIWRVETCGTNGTGGSNSGPSRRAHTHTHTRARIRR